MFTSSLDPPLLSAFLIKCVATFSSSSRNPSSFDFRLVCNLCLLFDPVSVTSSTRGSLSFELGQMVSTNDFFGFTIFLFSIHLTTNPTISSLVSISYRPSEAITRKSCFDGETSCVVTTGSAVTYGGVFKLAGSCLPKNWLATLVCVPLSHLYLASPNALEGSNDPSTLPFLTTFGSFGCSLRSLATSVGLEPVWSVDNAVTVQ
ncbi:hypothetical protein OGAPHI_001133 [Ogataea philodendri]|uniref:Uncharacterized protein n=1 Tax=Ogataea philodendri TaxID=1378263 RepID=A0A9P8PE62_9ASCO|nr:uncharacterized protein OGAPHI_001133 [Ogataea philodendri]KAH3670618.1 hypothetical protein OGAPHI_001133 [Ogataea philodendri]